MIRIIIFLAAALLSAIAQAGEAQNVIRLWGGQGGLWKGHIDIYGPASPVAKTVALTTRWDAAPDQSIVTKIETFSSPDTELSSVTVMFAAADGGDIITPYFAKGRQRDYRFSVVAVSLSDATHWTTTIATPGLQEIYEDRPAQLRYLRTRNGDTIENTKEVRFLDGARTGSYELRSFIRQTREP
ncbi:MAG: hypothetical protein ACI87W_002043 [Halieaceae bacterium]|jgi:hypothetical protein